MNVLMICSSQNEISDYYKSIARSISHFFAINDCDLVFGGASQSMMGICYDEFAKMNRNIYAFTTNKYKEDLFNMPHSKHYLCETTFDLKKRMYENSDFIVCLPGGTGTMSELLSYIEENRSNDKSVPIIIYDEDKYYNNILKFIDIMIDKKFNNDSIYSVYNVATNINELENLFIEINSKEKRRMKS